jgi:hypothetical protein
MTDRCDVDTSALSFQRRQLWQPSSAADHRRHDHSLVLVVDIGVRVAVEVISELLAAEDQCGRREQGDHQDSRAGNRAERLQRLLEHEVLGQRFEL